MSFRGVIDTYILIYLITKLARIGFKRVKYDFFFIYFGNYLQHFGGWEKKKLIFTQSTFQLNS